MPVSLAAGGVILSMLLCPAPASAAEPEPPNVVFILLDSARADRFSSYGYGKSTTPRMDEIARQGALFLNNFSPASLTQESLPRIFSSRRYSTQLFSAAGGLTRGRRESPRTIFLGLDPQQVLLPQVLSGNGYHTALFTDHGQLRDKNALTVLFDERHYFESRDVREEAVFSNTNSWLEKNRQRKFFLYIHILSPHWSERSTQDLPASPDGISADVVRSIKLKMDEPLSRGTKGFSPEELSGLQGLYDNRLHVVDELVGSLYDKLKELGLAGKTALIISSDHGENLGEHGKIGHGGLPWDTVTRVPLILVYPPRVRPGAKVQGLTESIDLMPTILELAHAPLPPNKAMDGVSLLGVVDHPATAKTAVFWKDAVRTPDYKCLKTKSGLSLYALRDDPGETTDIADRKSEVAKQLMERHEHAVHDLRRRYELARRAGAPDFSFSYPVSEFQLAPTDTVTTIDSGSAPWLLNTDGSEYGLYRTSHGDPAPLTLSAPVPDGSYRVSLQFRYSGKIAPAKLGFAFRLRPHDGFIPAADTKEGGITTRDFHYFALDLGTTAVTNDRFSVEIRMPPLREGDRCMIRNVLFEPVATASPALRGRLSELGYW